MKRLFVDFNTLNSEPVELLKLGEEGAPDRHLLHSLKPGERVIFFDGELEVEGTVDVTVVHGARFWLGTPDWSTQRDQRAAHSTPHTAR
jgi:hypothetical protein